MELNQFVDLFAQGIMLSDSRRPQVVSTRTGKAYQPGIGPHSEPAAIKLVMQELVALEPTLLPNYKIGVPYLASARQKCDLVIGESVPWYVEVKMARFKGDNGKPADESFMHLLSPYENDRSALSDCLKLSDSGFAGRLAVLIYGFEFADKPLEPIINAFETLARSQVVLAPRVTASFSGLVHPVHKMGKVFAWEITPGST